MKTMGAFCAAVLGASLLASGGALADQRCPPSQAVAGICAPVHRVDDRGARNEQRAYDRGYRDGIRGRHDGRPVYNSGRSKLPPPSPLAMDPKEGHSHRYGYRSPGTPDRRYDRNRRYDDRRDYDRYDQRRRYRGDNDNSEVFDFATDILRGLAD